MAGMKEYQGMMQTTANETASGLMSQLQDTFEINVVRRWGQGLQDGVKKGLGTVLSLIDNADAALEKFGDTIYEVGKTISNWLADKLAKTVERITEITDSFEFKEASLGEKLKMLWKGVIVDPLKEWWEGGGQQKTAETAGKIGKWMGEALTKGLLVLFGVTDVFKEGGLDESGGATVAQSFARGFVDAFDVSAITEKLKEAISNVWNALPWWGKALVIGYGGGKAISGIGNVVGGAMNLIGGAKGLFSGARGLIGSTGNAIVGGSGLLGTFANAGYALTGGAAASGLSGGMAALAGGGAITGGIVGGVTAIKGGFDLYGAYKAHKAGDTNERDAKIASGSSALAGVATGALIGSIFGPVGTLVGAGIGGVAGWIGGEKWANNIRQAKYETEGLSEELENAASEEERAAKLSEAMWESAKEHFGDIKLSASEIERLVDQIVWGEDLGAFEKFSSATKNAEANLQSLKDASAQTDKWLWKAGLGVKFNEDEQESMKKSFDDYISSAKSYLENKHYEFTASAELLLDLESEEGKSILEGGNAFYLAKQDELDKAGKELGDALSKALEDGIINADESDAIIAAQEKVANILDQIANAEQAAEIELIKVKFGDGNLDLESFETFMSTMKQTIEERVAAADEAFKVQVENLEFRYPDHETDPAQKAAYEKELQTIIDGYNLKVEGVKADIMGVELDIIGDAYSKELGEDAAKDLRNVLTYAFEKELSSEDLKKMSHNKLAELLKIDPEDLTEETAGNIKAMLGGVLDQLELLEVDGDLLLKIGETKVEGGSEEKVKEEVDKTIPDTVDTTVGVNVSGEKEVIPVEPITREEFGIKPFVTYPTGVNIDPFKGEIGALSLFPEDFNIYPGYTFGTTVNVNSQKGTIGTLALGAGDFGVAGPYNFSPTVNITPVANTTPIRLSTHGLVTDQYRGGIVGGSSALEGFAEGGMVRGGARLIKVAEEGTPEMIIPLGSHRRERAMKLWEKAGEMLNIPGFARGGRTDGGQDEGIRFRRYGADSSTGGQTVQVEVGGITVEINVDATNNENIVEAIRSQGEEIAETVAGILADAFGAQFENTPVRGGVA